MAYEPTDIRAGDCLPVDVVGKLLPLQIVGSLTGVGGLIEMGEVLEYLPGIAAFRVRLPHRGADQQIAIVPRSRLIVYPG